MLWAYLRAASIRHWVSRPDCPPAMKVATDLFKQAYGIHSDLNSEEIIDEEVDDDLLATPTTQIPEELRKALGNQGKGIQLRARHHYQGVIYTRSETHIGNSLVEYYPDGCRTSNPIPGSIQYIFADVKHSSVSFAIRHQRSRLSSFQDPFKPYPYIPAKIYRTELEPELGIINPEWVYSHYARFEWKDDHCVVMSLNQIRLFSLKCFLILTSILVLAIFSSEMDK